ncbi:putative V-type proton ATPase subunit a, vacuolar [Blattamonas nauphoetae]|uniref:V-type proton ATPase subunit a n=1 Tax=Blattamonas nauphoetae TaxID=2049346 RepID=A0ABQ9Y8M6_9EUKA|nr:putative V-type proton ATPase subunit a, vacuolar [Blattamonas nauphoetae]
MDKPLNIFRSETMLHRQFIIPRDSLSQHIKSLQRIQAVDFCNLNFDVRPTQLPFFGQINLCHQSLGRLKRIQNVMTKFGMDSINGSPDPEKEEIEDAETLSPMRIEEQLVSMERDLDEQLAREKELCEQQSDLQDMIDVLSIGQTILLESFAAGSVDSQVAVDPTYLKDLPQNSLSKDEPNDNLKEEEENRNADGNNLYYRTDVEGPSINQPPSVVSQGQVFLAVQFVAGIVSLGVLDIFHRLLMISLRGNVLFEYRLAPQRKDSPPKAVFLVFFSGPHSFLTINRLCLSYNATLFPFHEEGERSLAAIINHVQEMLGKAEEKLRMNDEVLSHSHHHIETILASFSPLLPTFSEALTSSLRLYSILNRFVVDSSSQMALGEGWVSERMISVVEDTLAQTAKTAADTTVPFVTPLRMNETSKKARILENGTIIPLPDELTTPPTLIRTNAFTAAPQKLINSFGTPTYKEINPALSALVTFPFLFAIMFGDVGHGAIVLLVGVLCCVLGRKGEGWTGGNDILRYFHIGRILLVLMGAMSIFTGLLYNEFFSISLPMFKSGWKVEAGKMRKVGTYVFGVDSIWRQCDNSLLFLNSLKMKMSILIAVLHMSLGLVFSLLNSIHTSRPIDALKFTFFTFLPKLTLFLSLFGYLSFLIVFKWLDASTHKPMLISVMIDMFLSPTKKMSADDRMFKGQETIQLVLVGLALFSIVWMVVPNFVMLCRQACRAQKEEGKKTERTSAEQERSVQQRKKPKYLTKGTDTETVSLLSGQSGRLSVAGSINSLSSEFGEEEKQKERYGTLTPTSLATSTTEAEEGKAGGEGEGDGDERSGREWEEREPAFDSGLFVHLVIDTIEYVLGCVSNTASYLRLWALSLAHSQLSEVFFDYLSILVARKVPVFGSVIGMPALIGATAAVLCGMEGLSAFLHCLRLHWVEFMNKFYVGEGREWGG